MNLQNISLTACPVCGEREVISENIEISTLQVPRVLEHVNGGRWEKRKFLCGYVTEYHPNGRREEEGRFSQCTKDPELIKRKRSQKALYEKALELLDSIDSEDRVFIDNMKESLGSVKWRFEN